MTLLILLVCSVGLAAGHKTYADEVTEREIRMRGGRFLKGKKRRDLGTLVSWRDFEYGWARKKNKLDKLDGNSFDDCEKMRDKYDVTCVPSQSPTSAPSVAPSISQAPSISSQPSFAPSNRPSSSPSTIPSDTPSQSPTESAQPSDSPSNQPSSFPSASPSAHPTGALFTTLELTRDDGSVWEETTCEVSLPAGASAPQAQETLFEYFLHVTPETDPTQSIAQVERAISASLAEQTISCFFDQENDIGAPFELYAISSLPMDVPNTALCPEDVILGDGSECYGIKAGFTPTIFYNNRRRRLGETPHQITTQTESEIIAVFGPMLQQILDSDMFVGGDIVATNYSGFPVDGASGADDSTEGSSTSSIQGNAATADNGSGNDTKKRQYMIGGIVVGLAAVALVVVALILVQRRREYQKRRDFEECNDSVLDSDDDNSKQNMQEGFPRDGSLYLHDNPEGTEGVEVNESDLPRVASSRTPSVAGSQVTSRDASELGKSPSSVQGIRYSVVNDEETVQSSLYGLDSAAASGDNHDYENCKNPSCFKCRTKELAKPTFVKADLQAIQTELGSNKTYTPKHQRKYIEDDTVDL